MHSLVCIAVKIMQTHTGHHGKMPKCLLKASRFVEHYISFEPICVRVYMCFCACIRIFREDQKDVYQTVNIVTSGSWHCDGLLLVLHFLYC